MGKILSKMKSGLLILLPLIGLGPAYAAPPLEEHHVDARMQYLDRGAIASTYGYLRVFKDQSGNALIETMFANGNPAIDALFNAGIRLLDASGRVLHRVELKCPLSAGDVDEATECKVSKSLRHIAFDTVEVDFYLSDMPGSDVLAMH